MVTESSARRIERGIEQFLLARSRRREECKPVACRDGASKFLRLPLDAYRFWHLPADRLREPVDQLFLRPFDEDADLRFGAAVADQHASVLAQFLFGVLDRAGHQREGIERRLFPDRHVELAL